MSSPTTERESEQAVGVPAERPTWVCWLRQAAWLTLALAAVLPLFVWAGSVRTGTAGMWAALVAVGLCWVGGVLALACTAWMQGPQGGVQGTLAGMFFRAGLPFVAGLLLERQPGVLAEGRIFGMVLACYLFTLLVETILSLQLIRRTPQPRGGNAPSVVKAT